jgi:hypothetical protein
MTSQPAIMPARRKLRILRRQTESIRPASPRPQRRDCQGQLIAAIEEAAGPEAQILEATMRPWCSATFLGAQHRLTLRMSGAEAATRANAFAANLPEAAFTLRGHIVADATVDTIGLQADGSALLHLAILTIEDW